MDVKERGGKGKGEKKGREGIDEEKGGKRCPQIGESGSASKGGGAWEGEKGKEVS